ncbi:putative uncharacterized protein [Clostridium sp. CAG:762]|nr:putative uncharacterized protein [Clostridium sp. CAG:762]
MSKENKMFILITIILILIILGIIMFCNFKEKKDNKKMPLTEGVAVVPTMNDRISGDSSWCGTFQLVWNDMKNQVVGKDIVFTPQLEMAENLNLEDFNENMISSNYYYKAYGLKTLELKKKIEDGIKIKFNQSSDILNDFDWSDDALNKENTGKLRYFFYTMLYREFNYLYKFDVLKNDRFANYNNAQYFGIDNSTNKLVREQIEVLFYNDKNNFALLINTKDNDQVIYYKNPKGNTFNEIYDNMLIEKSNYKGDKNFNKNDYFKAPYIDFNVKRVYEEFENKKFETNNPVYPTAEIMKAIQSISFSINEKGGKVKSEAGIDVVEKSTLSPSDLPRYFYVDDKFAIFLKEKNRDKPYFGSLVNDITKYQPR